MGGLFLIIQRSLNLEDVQARVEQVLTTNDAARDVLNYVASARGKGLRPLLVLLTFDLCGGTRFEEAINCAAGVELVHMASLIHDDIIDRSQLRRGQMTVHSKFGIQAAVLAGDHLFASAFHLFALGTDRKVSQVMTAVIQNMCSGEISQLLSPARTEADYLDYIRKKTACLIGGCCCLGAVLSDASEAEEGYLKDFGERIGLAFQLTDDVLDYRGVGQMMGKEEGRDFAEGLWTLPTIRAFGRGLIPSNWPSSDFHSIRTVLQKEGVLDEVMDEASAHVREAQRVLDRFPPSSSKAELASLLATLTERAR